MKNQFVFIALCLLLFSAYNSNAQLLPDSLLNRYNKTVPQEKIYAHFDNNVYIPGQVVWYKLYLQSTRELTEMSRNVYVDWYDEKGKIITKHTSPVNHSVSWGSFEIPASYTGNRLYAVAYTQWMLNFDSAFLFRKEFVVASAGAKQTSTRAQVLTEHSLHFFPEGGDLVEGLSSVLAFKALNREGRPGKAEGFILNAEKKQVMPFATEHNGMSKLVFTPAPGETYFAEWTDADGAKHESTLPAVKKSGIVLNLKDGSLDRFFNLSWTPDIPGKLKRFQIVAHSNQKLLFKAIAEINNKKTIVGSLPLGRFPSGVITLTILNETGQPLAERICFVNNEEYRMDAGFGVDTLGLQKREKNVYEINIPDSIPANLSLAVTAGDLPIDSTDNIITSLLLSSEIKGYIHNPAYYFSSEEDSVKQQLDLVMLTNGWRRFKWEEAVKSKKPDLTYPKEDQFISFSATIKQNSGSGSQLKKSKIVNLIFQAKDSSRSFAVVPLIDGSWFEYQNMFLFDTVQVFYQINNVDLRGQTSVKASTNLLQFNPKDSLRLRQAGFVTNDYLLQAPGLSSDYNGAFGQGTTLAEVIVRSNKKPKKRVDELNDEYTSGLFKNGDAYQLNLVDDESIRPSTNLINYLQSKVPGLRQEAANGSYILRWRGNNSFGGPTQGDPVAILINEMMVSTGELSNINASDIAYIKVFRPPFLGVPLGNGGSGAIAIYTRSGADRKQEAGIDKFPIAGYTVIKDFYSPDYAELRQTYKQADLRRTLYWKPDIITDGYNNRIRISFYNNDVSNSMQVVLQGMSEDGKLIHISRMIK